jgi:hypothetical protein
VAGDLEGLVSALGDSATMGGSRYTLHTIQVYGALCHTSRVVPLALPTCQKLALANRDMALADQYKGPARDQHLDIAMAYCEVLWDTRGTA